MSSIKHQDRIAAIEVLNLTDSEAVKWLKENTFSKPHFLSSTPEQERHKIVSFAFARRKSARVRLAVAKYGSHIPTLRRIFQNGTSSERLAVLSNAFVGPAAEDSLFRNEKVLCGEKARNILRRHKLRIREFSVLLSNPNIDRDWLENVIENWHEIDGLDDNGLLLAVRYLADNPVINRRRDDTFMDGWAEHSYEKLNFALADLLQSVPVTLDWAWVLGRMLENLNLPYIPDFDAEPIERWTDPEPTDKGERLAFPFLREQITHYLIVKNHRSEIREKYTVDHKDPAVRKGLYSSLPPYYLFNGISLGRNFSYPSFQHLDETNLTKAQQQILDFCRKCFERDKNDFVEGLIWNNHFWKSKEERNFLGDIAWHLAEDPNSMMDVPNLYRGREAWHLEHNPTFFKDDEFVDVPYEDTIEGKLSKLESDLDKIREEVKSQSLEDLADQQRAHFESIIKDTQYQICLLSKDVSNKTEELAKTIAQGSITKQFSALESRIRRQSGLLWLLIIALALYFFLRVT